MSTEIQKKLRLDDRFSWSFAGVLLALLFGGFAFYAYFHQARPNIVCEIESQSDVFDLHRPLQDLAISFRGQDIQQQNLNVRILTVRLWNQGGVDILQGFYDQQEPWGIKVDAGQIIEVRVGQSNSSYLKTRLDPRITAPDTIMLNKVIFERGKFSTLDILVLYHRDAPPHIVPFGKIAGINEIPVVDVSAQDAKPGFWEQVTVGTPLVHIVRFVGYFILLAVTGLTIGGIGSLVSGLGERRRRERIRHLLGPTPESDNAFDVLQGLYIKEGLRGLESLSTLLHDKQKLKTAISASHRARIPFDTQAVVIDQDPFFRYVTGTHGEIISIPRGHWLRQLTRDGLVKITKEDIAVNPQLTDALDQLLTRLKEPNSAAKRSP